MNKYIVIVLLVICYAFSAQTDSLKAEFEDKYKKWIVRIKRPDISDSAESGKKTKCKEFDDLVELGVNVLPYAISKFESKNSLNIRIVIRGLLKFRFDKSYNSQSGEIEFNNYPDYKGETSIFRYWLYKGRKRLPQALKLRYEEYRELVSKEDFRGAKAKLKRIQWLGYDALPAMIEMIKEDKTDLIPVVSRLTASKKRSSENLPASAKAEEVLQWWEDNKERFLVPVVE